MRADSDLMGELIDAHFKAVFRISGAVDIYCLLPLGYAANQDLWSEISQIICSTANSPHSHAIDLTNT
ncbi:hypothetical protein ACSYAD_03515 [Acaryochloris marina NIES-2412]|uniref:hypothetical protein n=1 Tax=Acaryochloris marina TaxID=155978 RepID=UPI004059A684